MQSLAAMLLMFALAQEPVEEGVLLIGAREAVCVSNPGDEAVDVTLSLQRGGAVIEEVIVRVAPGGSRVMETGALFTASADGAQIAFHAARGVLVSGYEGGRFTPALPAGGTRRRRSVRFPASPPPPPLVPRTVVLTPSKDNTLYQDAGGTRANGKGGHLFAGATGARLIRRTLLAFDLASQIPAGSQVTRVVLTLTLSQTITGPQSMTLHRVAADWGEGASNAGLFRDGNGAAAQAGDATWLHRFFPNQQWASAGGDFDAASDAAATANFIGDPVVWESPAMIARVQQWVDQPSTNFGWIIRGNENSSHTAKRTDSREVGPEETRPSLRVEFNGPP